MKKLLGLFLLITAAPRFLDPIVLTEPKDGNPAILGCPAGYTLHKLREEGETRKHKWEKVPGNQYEDRPHNQGIYRCWESKKDAGFEK